MQKNTVEDRCFDYRVISGFLITGTSKASELDSLDNMGKEI